MRALVSYKHVSHSAYFLTVQDMGDFLPDCQPGQLCQTTCWLVRQGCGLRRQRFPVCNSSLWFHDAKRPFYSNKFRKCVLKLLHSIHSETFWAPCTRFIEYFGMVDTHVTMVTEILYAWLPGVLCDPGTQNAMLVCEIQVITCVSDLWTNLWSVALFQLSGTM